MATQQIVILANGDSADSGGNGMAPLGSRGEVFDSLLARNTGPDEPGSTVLHGPGFTIELAPEQDPITQMLLTINDDDIAWIVIMRLARDLHWKLLDPLTGRELKPR